MYRFFLNAFKWIGDKRSMQYSTIQTRNQMFYPCRILYHPNSSVDLSVLWSLVYKCNVRGPSWHRDLLPRLLSPLNNGMRFICSPQRLKLFTVKIATNPHPPTPNSSTLESLHKGTVIAKSPQKNFRSGLSTVELFALYFPHCQLGSCSKNLQDLRGSWTAHGGDTREDLTLCTPELDNQWPVAM